ncbi:MAG: glycosyltransferase family 4 protein [Candidatus Omnitrophica bacterium]|nr:glycosyltransferase family 4 protein [Candidatus Omnitrophota bacterium]
MKVCVVSRGDLPLFPPTQGASVKLFYTLKTLSELGLKMYFVSAEDEHYFEVKKGKFIKRNYPWFIAKTPVKLFHKIILSWFGIPRDIFVLYHPLLNFGLWLKVLYVVLREKIDLIQAEFTAFGVPALFVKSLTLRPVTIVEHNVETFQLPKVTSLTSTGKKIVKLVEKLVCTFSDAVVVMCGEEKKRLLKLGVNEKKIFIIPHGVDLKLYKNFNLKKIKKKYGLKFPTLIFHGTYSYKPNYEAIRIIAKKIIPELEKRGVKIKLLAVGNSPPSDINHPNIIFTGPVKNLAKFIKAADIAIVPIRHGGGIRMKILEYFAAKKPVISTKKGAEGIPAKNGKEIILTKMKKFPEEIMKLINTKKLREYLAENAYKFVQNYDWKKICKKYIEVYERITKSF